MFKKLLYTGVMAGIFAAIAALIYKTVYTRSLGTDFPETVTITKICVFSVATCLLMSFLYLILYRWLKGKTDFVFNLISAVLSFASIVIPFAVKLPLTTEMPEIYPGLVIPMHFFPPISWLVFRPVFLKSALHYYTLGTEKIF